MNAAPSFARLFLILGALNLAASIALGAAGMHGLKAQLIANDPAGLFQTALHYHELHALGLLAVGLEMRTSSAKRGFVVAGGLMLAGIVLFCGNLYLRSIVGLHDLRALTPFGGGAFIFAWLAFAYGAWRGDR